MEGTEQHHRQQLMVMGRHKLMDRKRGRERDWWTEEDDSVLRIGVIGVVGGSHAYCKSRQVVHE